MNDKYVLKNGEPVVEHNLIVWAEWYEGADRTVALDEGPNYVISTVFLGLGHQFNDGPPLLFETMVFKTSDWGTGFLTEQDMRRYSTAEEAKHGHAAMVKEWVTKP